MRYMPQYTFRLHTLDRAIHLPETAELPGLREALIAANRAARTLIHRQRGHGRIDVHGTLDVEDEGHRPVARILLAEVARQIS
jgi:hypothetical protein